MATVEREENVLTIWKQEIQTRTNMVRMPWPFTILSVQSQDNRLHLWAEVEADNPVIVTRCIEVYGTGWDIPPHPDQKRFIGTAQTGPFVWHAYERGDGRVSTP
jgi:hypothetical protein